MQGECINVSHNSPPVPMQIQGRVLSHSKMSLSKTGFQMSVEISVNDAPVTLHVASSAIESHLGWTAAQVKSARKTPQGATEIVQLLTQLYTWIQAQDTFELKVGDGRFEWQL